MAGNRLDAKTFFTDLVFNGGFIGTGGIVRSDRVFEAAKPWLASTDLTPESRLCPCGSRGREAYSWSGEIDRLGRNLAHLANTYTARRLLGYPRVRNYLGSWGEWSNREELPVETA